MNPTGNITFLFTDVEGSTKLSQDYPDTLQAALDRHHSIMQDAVESNNGFVFEIIGDAFCCAFEKAEDAVKAAVDAQLNLANEKWNDTVIKIRIGIHSGDAEWNGKRYMGYITLARSARVMSSAYGEQIIVSNNTYELCRDKFDAVKEKNVSFRDLGERRLKDVIQPIRLYQIVGPGLREDFPPLKTLDARPNNLPIQLTSFIGREKELKFLKDELKQNRLLTLSATGGAGKSRLSLQAGADLIDDFANGVWFVELAAVNDPDFLTSSIINALGIKEEPKKTPEETLTDHLKDKEILIILDNCEHLINACAYLTERLLTSCPKLKIIATSREALNCAGEQTFKIPPLTHPDPNSKETHEQLTQYESVRLFIERALTVNPKFRVTNENAPALSEVCSRLDGIPLAIELAAARIKILSIEKIYERLDDRFNLLTGGKRTALPRQQTLRALVDWSYDLLNENEKILWSRLSVFSGGWTLESAEDICSDETINKYSIIDLLSELAEKSIINYNESKERYNILETIKQYGREKLENGDEIFLKHLNHFLELAQKAKPELIKSDIKKWLDILEADQNNFISAIEWAVRNEEIEKGARTLIAFSDFWRIRGYYSTGKELFEIIWNKEFEISKPTKAKVLDFAASFNIRQGDYYQAKKHLEESLEIGREIGDKVGISNSLNGLGHVSNDQGDYQQAKKYYEESLAFKKEIGEKRGIALCLNNLGNLLLTQRDYEQAKEYYKESLDIKKEIGDKLGISTSFHNLGLIAFYKGDYKQANKYYEESFAFRKEIGDKSGIWESLVSLGVMSYNQGFFDQAKRYYEECLTISKEIGDKFGIASCLHNLGGVALNKGEYELARKHTEESLDIFKEIGEKQGISCSLLHLGIIATELGEYNQAKKNLEKCLYTFKDIGERSGETDSLNWQGIVAFNEGNYDQAKKYYEEGLAISKEINDLRGIADSLINMGIVAQNQGDFELAKKFIEESLDLRKENGDKGGIAQSLLQLGNLASDKRYYIQAKKYYEESLAFRKEISDMRGIVYALIKMGNLTYIQGDIEIAVKLMSSSQKIMQSIEGVFDKTGQKINDETIAKLREQLNEEDFNKYWEEGEKLTLEEACQLAVRQLAVSS